MITNGTIKDVQFSNTPKGDIRVQFSIELDVGIDGNTNDKYCMNCGFAITEKGIVCRTNTRMLAEVYKAFKINSWKKLVGCSLDVMYSPLYDANDPMPHIKAISPAGKDLWVSLLNEDYHYDIVQEEKPVLWRVGFLVGSVWALFKQKEYLLMYYDWRKKKFAIGFRDGYSYMEGQRNKKMLDTARKYADKCGLKLVFRKKDA